MKQRDVFLDNIRILACFMVVLMHSPLPSENAVGPFLCALSYFTAPCIGLFFMVSGALLLPVKIDYITFVKKRFSKIAVPTLLWSIIYIMLNLYESQSEINILQQLCSLPFSNQGEGVLWFMYTLSGLYLLAPILSAWCEKASQKELQLILLLWAITLCYPLLDFWVITNSSTTGILYYFTGYAGYFLLGYYLRRYPHAIPTKLCYIIAAIGALLLLTLKHYNIPFDFYQLFWYQSIFIAALCIAIWKTIALLYNHVIISRLLIQREIDFIARLSMGVYLIHILIMRHWLWQQPWIFKLSNYPLQCMIIAFITMLLSIIICHLIAYQPKSEWIIGYHRKRTPASII